VVGEVLGDLYKVEVGSIPASFGFFVRVFPKNDLSIEKIGGGRGCFDFFLRGDLLLLPLKSSSFPFLV